MRAVGRAYLMPGLTFKRGPAQVEVVRVDAGRSMICRMSSSDEFDGQEYELPLPMFYDEYRCGHIVDLRTQGRPTQLIPHNAPLTSARWQAASDKQKKAALLKQKFIFKMRLLGPIRFDMAKRIDANLRKVANDLGCKAPCRTSFYTWYRTYMRSGESVESLLRRPPPRGKWRVARLHPRVQAELQKVLTAIEGGDKTSYRDLAVQINKLLSAADEDGVLQSPPLKIHESTIARWAKTLPMKARIARAHGAAEAEKLQRSAAKVQDPDFPLQVVITDHTYLKNVVVWNERLQKRHKGLHVTVFLDRRTRCCLGYAIHINRHDAEVVERCLTMAVLPKNDFKLWCPDAIRDWPCWGLPFIIVCDNGLEFLSNSLLDLCGPVGINVILAEGHTPEFKGSVERWFRTLKAAIERLRSPERLKERPDLPPDCLTLRELDAEIGRWIVDTYHHSKHEGIKDGRTPMQVWSDEIDRVHRPLSSSVDDLLSAVGIREPRSLSKSGIELDKDIYQSDELTRLWQKLGPGSHRVKTIKSSRTAHYIFVWDEVDDCYVKAFNTDPGCRPEFTREHWQEIRREAVRLGLNPKSPVGVTVAKASLAAKEEAIKADPKAKQIDIARLARQSGEDMFSREDKQKDARVQQRVQEELGRKKARRKSGAISDARDGAPTTGAAVRATDGLIVDLTQAPLEVDEPEYPAVAGRKTR